MAAAALEYLLDRKKVTASWYAALTLGMIGVALMAIGETALPEATPLLEARGEGAMLMDERKLIGIALGIVAGASYATYSLLARRMMLQAPTGVRRWAACSAPPVCCCCSALEAPASSTTRDCSPRR
ncbi:hypothetical protein ACU8V3_01695 [Cobetia marina]